MYCKCILYTFIYMKCKCSVPGNVKQQVALYYMLHIQCDIWHPWMKENIL